MVGQAILLVNTTACTEYERRRDEGLFDSERGENGVSEDTVTGKARKKARRTNAAPATTTTKTRRRNGACLSDGVLEFACGPACMRETIKKYIENTKIRE